MVDSSVPTILPFQSPNLPQERTSSFVNTLPSLATQNGRESFTKPPAYKYFLMPKASPIAKVKERSITANIVSAVSVAVSKSNPFFQPPPFTIWAMPSSKAVRSEPEAIDARMKFLKAVEKPDLKFVKSSSVEVI